MTSKDDTIGGLIRLGGWRQLIILYWSVGDPVDQIGDKMLPCWSSMWQNVTQLIKYVTKCYPFDQICDKMLPNWSEQICNNLNHHVRIDSTVAASCVIDPLHMLQQCQLKNDPSNVSLSAYDHWSSLRKVDLCHFLSCCFYANDFYITWWPDCSSVQCLKA